VNPVSGPAVTVGPFMGRQIFDELLQNFVSTDLYLVPPLVV
jgi:hypothetical protein